MLARMMIVVAAMAMSETVLMAIAQTATVGTTEKAEKGTGAIAAKTCRRRGRGGVPSSSPRLAEVSPFRFA